MFCGAIFSVCSYPCATIVVVTVSKLFTSILNLTKTDCCPAGAGGTPLYVYSPS